jgi:hypothetical protein
LKNKRSEKLKKTSKLGKKIAELSKKLEKTFLKRFSKT